MRYAATTEIDRMVTRCKERQLSMADFAREMGVSAQTVNNWKKRGNIPGRLILRAARVLECDPGWLQNGDNRRHKIADAQVGYATRSTREAAELYDRLPESSQQALLVLLRQLAQDDQGLPVIDAPAPPGRPRAGHKKAG